MKICNLEEANKLLASYVPLARELLGKDLTLARMKPLLNELGNPQNQLKIIHVAGTSGKTSTAYYIASLLKTAGKKVGLTVSPHLDSVTERVQINLEPLPEAVFCRALEEFLDLIAGVEPRPTYFELLIAFVYWHFAKSKVDYAVIEAGLGGSFDATNVAGKSDKICVITDIGLDHTSVLGKTITEIAGQKAGIIHTGNQVFMHQQSPAVMEVFTGTTKAQIAILNVLSNYENPSRGAAALEFAKLPQYQQHNWTLAKAAYDYIAERDSLPLLNTGQLARGMAIQVPGRMEVRTVAGKTIIMDGAHNQQKTEAFADSFKALYPGQKANILLALKEGKEYKSVLPLLRPICNRLIVTSFKTAQDLPIISINPQLLASAAEGFGFSDIQLEPDYKKAYELLLATPGNPAIITGSFYLLSSLRPSILKHT